MKLDLLLAKQNFEEKISFEGKLDLDKEMLNGDELLSGVDFKGTYMLFHDVVYLQGVASLTAKSECDRCLNPVEYKVECTLDEKFYKAGTLTEDADASFYTEAGIDLDELVRDKIILNLPFHKLCKDNCKGLCAGCGVNLNNEKCKCKKEKTEQPKTQNLKPNPFEVLKNLK